jgi:hypothetical protein
MAARATAARCATPKAPRGLLHHHPGHGPFAVYVGTRGVINWVWREVKLALDRTIAEPAYPLLPILAGGARPEDLPSFLSQFQCFADAGIKARCAPMARSSWPSAQAQLSGAPEARSSHHPSRVWNRRCRLCPRPGSSGRTSTLRNGRRSTGCTLLSGLMRLAGRGGEARAFSGGGFTASSAFLSSLAGPRAARGLAENAGSGSGTLRGRPGPRLGPTGAAASPDRARLRGRPGPGLVGAAFSTGMDGPESSAEAAGDAACPEGRVLAKSRRTMAPSTRSASRRSPLRSARLVRRLAGREIQPS